MPRRCLKEDCPKDCYPGNYCEWCSMGSHNCFCEACEAKEKAWGDKWKAKKAAELEAKFPSKPKKPKKPKKEKKPKK